MDKIQFIKVIVDTDKQPIGSEEMENLVDLIGHAMEGKLEIIMTTRPFTLELVSINAGEDVPENYIRVENAVTRGMKVVPKPGQVGSFSHIDPAAPPPPDPPKVEFYKESGTKPESDVT